MAKRIIWFFIVCCIGCYKDTDEEAPARSAQQSFSIKADSLQIEADGVSNTAIIANISTKEMADSDNVVTFETDLGLFAENNTKKISIPSTLVYDSTINDVKRQAMVHLVSGIKADIAHIKTTIKGVPKAIDIPFVWAYPDSLRIIPSTIYFKASYTDNIGIVVNLIRYKGKTSLYTPIEFTATDDFGNSVGRFQRSDSLSDSSAKCNFTYYFTDDTYPQGKIKFKAASRFAPYPKDSIYLNIYK